MMILVVLYKSVEKTTSGEETIVPSRSSSPTCSMWLPRWHTSKLHPWFIPLSSKPRTFGHLNSLAQFPPLQKRSGKTAHTLSSIGPSPNHQVLVRSIPPICNGTEALSISLSLGVGGEEGKNSVYFSSAARDRVGWYTQGPTYARQHCPSKRHWNPGDRPSVGPRQWVPSQGGDNRTDLERVHASDMTLVCHPHILCRRICLVLGRIDHCFLPESFGWSSSSCPNGGWVFLGWWINLLVPTR